MVQGISICVDEFNFFQSTASKNGGNIYSSGISLLNKPLLKQDYE